MCGEREREGGREGGNERTNELLKVHFFISQFWAALHVPVQVAELAMVRMFEDLPMNSLVDSMAELLAMTGDPPPEGTPKQATPTTRGSITVSMVVALFDHR